MPLGMATGDGMNGIPRKDDSDSCAFVSNEAGASVRLTASLWGRGSLLARVTEVLAGRGGSVVCDDLFAGDEPLTVGDAVGVDAVLDVDLYL